MTPSCTLVNIQGDNFGDDLNARAAAMFVTRYLGGRVSAGLSTAHQSEYPPDLGLPRDRQFRALPEGASRVDMALHLVGRLPHLCRLDREWDSINDAIASSDLVISVPSGAAVGPYRSKSFLIPFRIAEYSHVPTSMMLGTVLPSGSAMYDRFALWALRTATLSVRDSSSTRHLTRSGRSVLGGPDAVIGLLRTAPIEASRRPVLSVVFGPSLGWHPDANAAARDRTVELQRIAAVAESADLAVELIPHTPLPSERAELADTANRCGLSDAMVREDVVSSGDYVDAISSSRLVVAYRYHAMVVAASVGTPLAYVPYETKMVDFADLCSLILGPNLRRAVVPLADLIAAGSKPFEHADGRYQGELQAGLGQRWDEFADRYVAQLDARLKR